VRKDDDAPVAQPVIGWRAGHFFLGDGQDDSDVRNGDACSIASRCCWELRFYDGMGIMEGRRWNELFAVLSR
jgi:hypothetical protein